MFRITFADSIISIRELYDIEQSVQYYLKMFFISLFCLTWSSTLSLYHLNMALSLRSKTEIFLVGFEEAQILGAKLPTNRQVFKTFFYILHEVKLSKNESAKLAIRETIIFWEKARIQTRREDKCVEKLVNLYERWRVLQKSEKRTSETEKSKREKFSDELDMLFDIAHENVLDKLSIDDKEFLSNQRGKSHEGCILGVDEKSTRKEKRRAERLEKESARKRKYVEQQEREKKGNSRKIRLSLQKFFSSKDFFYSESAARSTSSSSSNTSSQSDSGSIYDIPQTQTRRQEPKKHLLSDRVLSASM